MEIINLSSFTKAIESLDEIIERYERESDDKAIRDAVIQRFEYTYSLAVKMLIRFLRRDLPEVEETFTFNETIRLANKMGLLLSDLEKWSLFRQKRNLSSHTYNEDVALDVVSIVKDFDKEVHYILHQLNLRND